MHSLDFTETKSKPSRCYITTCTSNQRLGSAFDDLDPRLSLFCQVGDDVICPCKICWRYQIRFPTSTRSINVVPYNLDSNGPFAASGHMVQNPPCWRASYALGHPKQRKCKFVLMKSLCSGCPSGQLALQHGGFCTI